MASEPFDFKAQAQALLKRLGQNPGAPLNQGLALAAVEAALRDAHAHGQGTAKSPGSRQEPAPRPARASSHAPIAPQQPSAPVECAHDWELDEFGDPAADAKCAECGMLQKDFQARCEHYYVRVGKGEVCMTCRKPKRRA